MDLKLNAQHDLKLTGYDLALVTGINLIKQRVKQRLLTILGEWFLDETIGLPWFTELNQKGIDQDRVRTLLIRGISGTEGVTEVTEFNLEYDNRLRKLTVSFVAQTDAGQLSDMVTV